MPNFFQTLPNSAENRENPSSYGLGASKGPCHQRQKAAKPQIPAADPEAQIQKNPHKPHQEQTVPQQGMPPQRAQESIKNPQSAAQCETPGQTEGRFSGGHPNRRRHPPVRGSS